MLTITAVLAQYEVPRSTINHNYRSQDMFRLTSFWMKVTKRVK